MFSLKKVLSVLIVLTAIVTACGCKGKSDINSSSTYVGSVSSYQDTENENQSDFQSDSENTQLNSNEEKGNKAEVEYIFIDGKALTEFNKSKYEYSYPLGEDVSKPPKVTALKSSGDGELKIVQAKSTNDKATVTLNGVTYSIIFSQKDVSNILNNTYYKLKENKKLNVAYFGGSITYGFGATSPDLYSWRALTTRWLKRKYPNADIKDINAGIGGTGSAYGVYRAKSDLKLTSSSDKPDLVFIEFAINDTYDRIDVKTAKSNMESIIRTIYSYVPDADIVILFTTDQACTNKEYEMLLAHKAVAESFKIPYISIGAMLWDDILAENGGNYPSDALWKKYFIDAVHPSDKGYAKYADYITTYLSKVFSAKKQVPSSSIKSYIPESAVAGLPLSPYTANLKGQAPVSGITVDNDGHIISSTAGTSFTFTFTGTQLKLWHYGKANGGTLSVSIDNGTAKSFELYLESENHCLFEIATGLAEKQHTCTVTLNSSSHGSYMEIWNFLISGSANQTGISLIK